MYNAISVREMAWLAHIITDTAGLKCPPLIDPPINITARRDSAIKTGLPVAMMVLRNRKVPRNSTKYLSILGFVILLRW